MTHDEQLEWERRAGRPAAAAAFVSALLGLSSLALQTSTLQGADDSIERALLIDDDPASTLISGILQGLSIALLAVVLLFLYRATRHRRPETPTIARYLAIAAPPIVGAAIVASQIHLINASQDVAEKAPFGGKAGREAATDLLTGGAAPVIAGIYYLTALGLVAAVVMISLNARRAGLLSSFMGILGVIVGVLMILPLLGPPIVQYFWVTALGLLFIDRWPGQRGRGPAWETGEPDPWPTAAEVRAQALGEAPPERDEPAGADDDDDYYDEDEPEAEPAAAGTAHPRSKKRKRKRRR